MSLFRVRRYAKDLGKASKRPMTAYANVARRESQAAADGCGVQGLDEAEGQHVAIPRFESIESASDLGTPFVGDQPLERIGGFGWGGLASRRETAQRLRLPPGVQAA